MSNETNDLSRALNFYRIVAAQPCNNDDDCAHDEAVIYKAGEVFIEAEYFHE